MTHPPPRGLPKATSACPRPLLTGPRGTCTLTPLHYHSLPAPETHSISQPQGHLKPHLPPATPTSCQPSSPIVTSSPRDNGAFPLLPFPCPLTPHPPRASRCHSDEWGPIIFILRCPGFQSVLSISQKQDRQNNPGTALSPTLLPSVKRWWLRVCLTAVWILVVYWHASQSKGNCPTPITNLQITRLENMTSQNKSSNSIFL